MSTSPFTKRFSKALQGLMKEHGITVRDVALQLGRSVGFVSEHTSGASAPDTDLMDAVAALITFEDGQACRTEDLVREIVNRLDRTLAGQVAQAVLDVTKDLPVFGAVTAVGTDTDGQILNFDSRLSVSASQDDLALAADDDGTEPTGETDFDGA